MKILVYPAMMEIGGSQINAIELAHGIVDAGHEVVMFGPRGDLVSMVEDLGLEYVVSPSENSWPSRSNMARLRSLVSDRGIDLLHGYEWGPAVDLAFGPHRSLRIPMVSTVMSMSVPDQIPRHVPMIVGTAELAAQQRARGRRVYLMEPPIDTTKNRSSGHADLLRQQYGFGRDEVVISIVCRLTTDLEKVQGVSAAIGAVGELAKTMPARLLIVGDGPGLASLSAQAEAINVAQGQRTVVLTGGQLDPRPAYDVADIVLGMGSSALKGMAFGKPLVVQGRGGFWRLLDKDSLPDFLETGWFGHGGNGQDAIAPILRVLISDPAQRRVLGIFGQRVVEERFSLRRALQTQAAIYDDAIRDRPVRRRVFLSLSRSALDLAKFKASIATQQAAARAKTLAPARAVQEVASALQ